MPAFLLKFATGFVTKKLAAKIAIAILEKMVKDTETKIDDEYLGTVIAVLKSEFGLD
jgi:hypothetical protein